MTMRKLVLLLCAMALGYARRVQFTTQQLQNEDNVLESRRDAPASAPGHQEHETQQAHDDASLYDTASSWWQSAGAQKLSAGVQQLSAGMYEAAGGLFGQSLAEIRSSTPKKDKKEHAWWQSPDVERVCKLMLMIALGKMMQFRFPGKETGAVQNLLLQVLLPAMLFKSSAKMKVELGDIVYLGGGFLLVFARILASALIAYFAFGSSYGTENAALRRTAILEVSSTASAMSVLPFISEFVDPELIALGGVVDLPMKVYTLIMMPFIVRKFGEPVSQANSSGAPKVKKNMALQILTDPLIMSVFTGMAWALSTNGSGTEALGFFGKGIDALAAAQTPFLFLLIGLKLTFVSKTPLFCLVLLLGSQGILLFLAWLVLLILNPGELMSKFIIIFVQGAPKFTIIGYMQAAMNQGTVTGYNTDFGIDIVGMAFPISSVTQCICGVMGMTYVRWLSVVALVFLSIAVALRLIFRSRFHVEPELDVPDVPFNRGISD